MSNWLENNKIIKASNQSPKMSLFSNMGKKLLAVVIALLLWFVANIESDIDKTVKVNVNYVNLPGSLIVVNNPPKKVNIRIQGPRSRLTSVSPKDIFLTIDLSHVSEGVSTFEIRTDNIKPPRGLEVTSISPAEIEVDVDKTETKTVKVIPIIEEPEIGFEIIGEPKVKPNKVKISGPKSIVERIDYVNTVIVNTKKEKSNFTQEVDLKLPASLIKLVDNKTITVSVPLKEKTIKKEFKDIGIDYINFDNFDLNKDEDQMSTELTFEGPYSVINNLSSKDIKLFVDGKDLKSKPEARKKHKLDVNVTYPNSEGLKLTKQEPKKIEIVLN